MSEVIERIATLIIDDDTALLDSWQAFFDERRLEVATASSWSDGLALFHVISPDVVIADYNLPGSKHGLQLLAEIRRLRPSVRVILISGAVEPGALDEIAQLGIVDRVIAKGDSTTAISSVLEEVGNAADRSEFPTDWQAFAAAWLGARSAGPDFEHADERLRAALTRDSA